MTDESPLPPKDRILDAAMMHVAFDGWSQTTFDAAVNEADVDNTVARSLFPRGPVDLALYYHRKGDEAMLARLAEADLADMRFRDRVAAAVRFRLEAVDDKEAVRRGTTLFALPVYAPDGARAIWGTADAIWDALGDTSDDVNWYTKRATLSAVYSATVLFWLGDQSEGHEATWAFLDRRIDDIMQIEKIKAGVNNNPVLSRLMTGPNWLLGQIKAPQKFKRQGLPGSWSRR
ncbi:COQ9 family protein [Sulfitobacter sp. HNIBRBA3233]|uniref:COQ9 family protein n=1 Tax=Sulfitobacter marinivivus TaxID=3158558 RepID=UPI0032DE68E7